jgi:hypothetical protein
VAVQDPALPFSPMTGAALRARAYLCWINMRHDLGPMLPTAFAERRAEGAVPVFVRGPVQPPSRASHCAHDTASGRRLGEDRK